MVFLEFEPGTAGWKAQTNPPCYGCLPKKFKFQLPICHYTIVKVHEFTWTSSSNLMSMTPVSL